MNAPEVRSSLDPDLTSSVLGIAAAANSSDGVAPLSDHVLLAIRHGLPASHLLLHSAHELVGYGFLSTEDTGMAGELVVHPRFRGHGHGRRLVQAALNTAAGAELRIWAHGEHPAALALAREWGFSRDRVLYRLRYPLDEPPTDRELPAGVRLRPFVIGQDEASWTAVNNRAFASHPDQGGWDPDAIVLRESEPWFDPAGFLLAERTDEHGPRLLGFHWTKIHEAGTADPVAPVGEVYVLGIDPDAQGTGLGAALTVAGLRYLYGRGIRAAMLYVDASNEAAVRLYTKVGFTPWITDTAFVHTGSTAKH